MKKILLMLPVLLLISSCTIAGMTKIPHYDLIAMLVAVAACFIMAFGFAMVEKFHRYYLETGQKRRKTWMVFAMTLVVFIFLLSLACSGEVTIDTGDYPPMECKGWTVVVGNYTLYDSYDCDDSEYHYRAWTMWKMDLLRQRQVQALKELHEMTNLFIGGN